MNQLKEMEKHKKHLIRLRPQKISYLSDDNDFMVNVYCETCSKELITISEKEDLFNKPVIFAYLKKPKILKGKLNTKIDKIDIESKLEEANSSITRLAYVLRNNQIGTVGRLANYTLAEFKSLRMVGKKVLFTARKYLKTYDTNFQGE